MIVSTSNIAKDATLTVTPQNSLQDPYVVTDGDYSSVYTDVLDGQINLVFEFPQPVAIGYVAIGGSNISRKDSILISSIDTSERIQMVSSDGFDMVSSDGFNMLALHDNSIDDSSLSLDESQALMYKVDIASSRQLSIQVSGTGKIAISEIAFGDYYEIPRGEQGGYARPWTVPNIKSRSASSLNSSPINLNYESREIKCTLSVPNNIMTDYDGWYKFIKFASINTFYVLEDDNKFHSYAGFNLIADPTKAHGQTRKLGVSQVKFNAYAKSVEGLFI